MNGNKLWGIQCNLKKNKCIGSRLLIKCRVRPWGCLELLVFAPALFRVSKPHFPRHVSENFKYIVIPKKSNYKLNSNKNMTIKFMQIVNYTLLNASSSAFRFFATSLRFLWSNSGPEAGEPTRIGRCVLLKEPLNSDEDFWRTLNFRLFC